MTRGYYKIKFVSYAYTLKNDTTCDGQIISACELVLKEKYLSCIQENTKWYWEKKKHQKVIISTTRTIVHPCLDVVTVKDVHDIPRSATW